MSVTFERKVGLDGYGNVSASAWLQDEAPADQAAQSEKAVDMLNTIKAAVYDTLGLEVFVDDSGILREKHEPVVSTDQAANKIATQIGGHSIRVMNQGDLDPGEQIPANIVEKCTELGITAVWANKGQYGRFWKEAVKQGEQPKIPDQRDPSKGGIIKG